MKTTRWYEANEIIPAPISLPADEDFGSVSNFKAPEYPAITKELISQPSFFDAWSFFTDHYDDFRHTTRAGVPSGSGAFEAWWLGVNPEPLSAPSPQGNITKNDIDKLMAHDDAEVLSLFTNTFYSMAPIGSVIDEDTLIYLTRAAMRASARYDAKETFEDFEVFKGVGDEEFNELMGTGYAARKIAQEIKKGNALK